jgi:ankyrin repeat protein
MIQRKYLFLLLTLLPLFNILNAQENENKLSVTSSNQEFSQEEHFEFIASQFLEAISNEDIPTIEHTLLRYPHLLTYTFSYFIEMPNSNQGASEKEYTLTPLTYAIAHGKKNAIKTLIEWGANINQKIDNILPLTFAGAITDRIKQKEIQSYLLDQGAQGYTPRDLINFITFLDSSIHKIQKIKKITLKTLEKKIISELLYQINQNPQVLLANITIKKEQVYLNSLTKLFEIYNPFKTAILSEIPWLIDFFLEITKAIYPNSRVLSLQLSNTFNLIDFVALTQNEEILDILLEEKPPISPFLMFNNDWFFGKADEKCYLLYQTQNPDTSHINDLLKPCISKTLLLTYNQESSLKEEKIKQILYELFDLIKNETELIDEDENQLANIKKLLIQLDDTRLINTVLLTEDAYLTERGYNILENYETLLSAAIHQNNFELVKLLVESGADINQYLTSSFQPIHISVNILHYAAVHGTPEIVSYLLDKGAHITSTIIRNLKTFKPEFNECFIPHLYSEKKRQRSETSNPIENQLPEKRLRIEKSNIENKIKPD